jgi:tungstate transport system ATP-binding protein
MNSPTVYRLEGVERRYGASFALHIERLEIVAGETFCLLGPTGAGKSTLLRLLSGLERADEGRTWFAGQELNGSLPVRLQRQMATVHQRPLLLQRSVRANVEYGLNARKAADPTRIDAILARLGLRPLAAKAARTLSGGQAQLVALARALVLQPDVMLLDEPTANLDPAHVALVEETVAQYRRERPLTVVWATHNLFQARRVAARVGLLLNGGLVEVAGAAEFFDQPRDARTAAFVQGKMVY